MKRKAIFALLAAVVSTSSVAAPDLSDCKLSVYKVEAKHSALGTQILAPDQIVSITRFQTEVPGQIAWQVQLSATGAAANSSFSSKNIGSQIAILCDGKEVARPIIQGPSGAVFVFTTGAQP